MKLEIKHLSSYLPYDLKGIFLNSIITLSVNYFSKGTERGYDISAFLSNNLKPILFPLSQFVKFTFSEEVEECLLNYSADFILNQTNRLPYFIIQEFLSNKIDVFGLIEAGLAEPVTEDFNPYK